MHNFPPSLLYTLPPPPLIGSRSGLMVSTLDSGASGPGSNPSWGSCAVFLGRTLYSQGDSNHPALLMATGKFNAGGNHAMD